MRALTLQQTGIKCYNKETDITTLPEKQSSSPSTIGSVRVSHKHPVASSISGYLGSLPTGKQSAVSVSAHRVKFIRSYMFQSMLDCAGCFKFGRQTSRTILESIVQALGVGSGLHRCGFGRLCRDKA